MQDETRRHSLDSKQNRKRFKRELSISPNKNVFSRLGNDKTPWTGMQTDKNQSPNDLTKYYFQRYKLFSRYDEGIMLDQESWYSVTPESIAIHHAERFQNFFGDRQAIIVDGFCGAGGNLIQFAKSSPFVTVIGCDISKKKIDMAKNNAKVYGVENQCQFICGDFMDIIKSLRAHVDAVFLSPPWGGIEYSSSSKYSLKDMTPNGFDVVRDVRKYLCEHIAFLVPRNTDTNETQQRFLSKDHPDLEFEQNLVGTKVKTVTIYLGGLVKDDDQPERSSSSDEASFDE